MRLGELAGADLRLNPAFFVLLLLYAAAGLLYEVMLLMAVLISHEMAHLVAARLHGLDVSDVELLPFGGRMRIYGLDRQEAAVEAVVSLAGPVHHLILLAAAVSLQQHFAIHHELLEFFVTINLGLALFNLLPCLPLDGGRVLRAHLAQRQGYLPATEQLASWGRRLAVVLVAATLLAAWAGSLSPTLLLLAGFLYWAAGREYASAAYTSGLLLAGKRRVLRERGLLPLQGLVVHPDTTVRQVYRRLTPHDYHLIWVAAEAGDRICGVLTEEDLVAGMEREGFAAPIRRLLKNGS